MLTEPQKLTLKGLADNPILTEVLKKLLESKFEAPSEMKNLPGNITDEFLGQFLRARIAGLNAIDEAFREIAQCKSMKDKLEPLNPAR